MNKLFETLLLTFFIGYLFLVGFSIYNENTSEKIELLKKDWICKTEVVKTQSFTPFNRKICVNYIRR